MIKNEFGLLMKHATERSYSKTVTIILTEMQDALIYFSSLIITRAWSSTQQNKLSRK